MLVASFIVFSLVVALCILVMKFFSYFSSFVPTRKQWNSWTLPSKYSWVGFLGVFFSIFAWAVVPSDFLIFSMKPPLEETAFVHYGNVVSIRFEGGRTKSESIQILGARTHATAVFAEYHWLRKYFPRHAIVLQRIDRYSDPRYKKEKIQVVNGEEREMKSDQPSVGDRVLDAITIINWLRVKQTYFFDVTECMRMGETDPRQIRSSGQINK